MQILVALGLILVVVTVRSRKEQRALVWVVVGTAVFLCVVGLLKRFDILVFTWWDYTEELGRKFHGLSLTGVYVNRNHMAGFLEMAIPMMLWVVYWFFRTGFTRLKSRSRQTQGITLGAMAALVALLIHSYSDGNLQIPANALLFTALAAAGLRSFR
ncbi:MAG: hypothetical protein K9K87_13700 [Desulfotignum sp.]|nr:hypothetical protein [Desulfotignum sp.]